MAEADKKSQESIEVQTGRSIGAIYAVKEIAGRLFLTDALGNHLKAQLVILMIANRVIHWTSLPDNIRWLKTQEIESVFGIKSDDLTQNNLDMSLDWLDANQYQIERYMLKRYKDDQLELTFLDVTLSYIEGEYIAPDECNTYQDNTKGKKRIMVGLFLDTQGYPVALRMFEYNSLDFNAVTKRIRNVAKKLGVSRLLYIEKFGEEKINLRNDKSFDYRDMKSISTTQIQDIPAIQNYTNAYKRRTRARIFIRMLANLINCEFERLTDHLEGTTQEKWYLLDHLMTVFVKVDEIKISKCAKPTVEACNILEALNISIPHNIETKQ